MFDKPYEEQLVLWREFREGLKTSEDPVQDTIDFYSSFPTVRMNTDPYDMETWPTPWELLQENSYCNYCILLGICYTIQLSERFKGTPAEIHIGINKEKSDTWFVLHIANTTIGYETNNEFIRKIQSPKDLQIQKIHYLSSRH